MRGTKQGLRLSVTSSYIQVLVCVLEQRPLLWLTLKPRKRKTHDDDQIKALEDQISILKSYANQLESNAEPSTLGDLEDKSKEYEVSDQDENDSASEHCGPADGSSAPTSRSTADLDGRLPHAVDELSRLLWTTHIGKEGEASFQGPSGSFASQQPMVNRRGDATELPDAIHTDPMAQHYIHNAEIKQDLAAAFLEHINAYHHFVDESFVQDALFDPKNPLPLQFLHAAVLAAGSCYTKSASAVAAGNAFTAFAESIALKCCREHPSDQVISGLAVLSWLQLSREENHMGWVYNSMAASLVVHLGLHFPLPADLDHVSLTRKPSDAAGKRVFWSVCVLDRMATLTLGRNCAIPWRRIKIPFPGICEQFEGCETDTAFALQCRLSYLFDKYMDQIYTFDFDDQDAHSQLQLLMSARDALLGFQDRMNEHCPMPTSTTSNSVPTTAACLLYTSYYMSMILIHRPFLVILHTDTVRRVAFRTMTTAANASTKVLRNLMHHHSSATISNMPFPLVHHVLTTAVSHLINATSSDDRMRRTAANGLRTCLKALELLRDTWQGRASRAIAAIQELANRWRVVTALPINFSEPPVGRAALTDGVRRGEDDFALQGLGECGSLDGFAIPAFDLSEPDMFFVDGNDLTLDLDTWQG